MDLKQRAAQLNERLCAASKPHLPGKRVIDIAYTESRVPVDLRQVCVSPQQALFRVASMQSVIQESLVVPRLYAWLVAFFPNSVVGRSRCGDLRDIDSRSMPIHIQHGKGGRDR